MSHQDRGISSKFLIKDNLSPADYLDVMDTIVSVEFLSGIYVIVTAKDEKGTALDNAGAWTCGIDQNKTAYVAVTLKDTKIPFLPATGGMGTVIFTIVGDALMILAIVLFIRSRKGRKEDK